MIKSQTDDDRALIEDLALLRVGNEILLEAGHTESEIELLYEWVRLCHRLAMLAQSPDIHTKWYWEKEAAVVKSLKKLWGQIGHMEPFRWSENAVIPPAVWVRQDWGGVGSGIKSEPEMEGLPADAKKIPGRQVEIEVHRDRIVCIYPNSSRQELQWDETKAQKSWVLLAQFAEQDNSHEGRAGKAPKAASVREMCRWLERQFGLVDVYHDTPGHKSRSIQLKRLSLFKDEERSHRRTLPLEYAEYRKAREDEEDEEAKQEADWLRENYE